MISNIWSAVLFPWLEMTKVAEIGTPKASASQVRSKKEQHT